MTTAANDLRTLGGRLIGEWTTEATHPAFPGTIVHGMATIEWLEGEKFLLLRGRVDHPDFPDSIAVLGDTDGLRYHYFDSRGVHRIYDLTITAEHWKIAREVPAAQSDFSQRLTLTFVDEDNTLIGSSQISHDNETWTDDLQITYRRADET